MAGLAVLLFVSGLLLSLVGVYFVGFWGWGTSALFLSMGWAATAIFQWTNPAVLVVEILAGGLTLWLELRWTLRHQAWQARITHDKAEAVEKQQQIANVVQTLKDKISTKSADVDRGLKQYELIRKLAEAVSWEEMAPSLERSLKHFFHCEAWSLYLTDDKSELKLVHRRGGMPDPREEDVAKKEPYLHTFVASSGTDVGRNVWVLAMPLWRLHERIGLLLVRLPDLPADQHQLLLAEAGPFSVQLIFAMAKAKLYRELDQRSRTDGLTGLSRRGPFEERLKEEVARANSFRTTFSILMIDIDHFKRLNDTYGHQVGDEVLRTVSQRLREGIYETDVIARYGGEEFVCLLPRSEAAGLKVKADQIRHRVASEAFVIGLEAIQVTISVGIAHFPKDGRTPEEVMGAADRALYAAKAAGRNCVVEASTLGRQP